MYYNVDDALSYNALFTLIVGGRGLGKSYSAKRRAIKNFINKGEQFVYLRRYKTELKSKVHFFDDICAEFPNHEFKVNNNAFVIDGKDAGYTMTLSTQNVQKSTPYPKVSLIIFDEFLIDPRGNYRYITNEVDTFLEAYSTVARDRDVRVLFLANNVSMYNPYFMYWGLHLKAEENKCRKGDIILLKVESKEFTEHMLSTRFGKIIAGTAYGDYAIGNTSMTDNSTFIEKKEGTAFYYYGFYYDGEFYGVWEDETKGMIYISPDYDPYCKAKYTLSMSDHSPNTIMLKSISAETCWRLALMLFKQGKVRFEDGKCKAAWLGVMHMVNEVRV